MERGLENAFRRGAGPGKPKLLTMLLQVMILSIFFRKTEKYEGECTECECGSAEMFPVIII